MSNLALLNGEASPIHWTAKSDLDYETMENIIHVASTIETAHPYWIGDMLIYAKVQFGERYAQLIPDNKAESWRQYEWVCSRVPPAMRKHLSGYTQARIVARLSPERQTALVNEINVSRLTTRELTDEVRNITRDKVRDPGKLPDKKFRVIYADPPWQYNDTRDGIPTGHSAAEDHYQTMPLQAICDLPVRDIADKDAVLFLWITTPLMYSHAPAVITAWGFEYKAEFVWDKDRHIPGNYNSVRHEHLLICLRGQCQPADTYTLRDSVQTIKPSSKHSEKPEEFRAIIDEMYPEGDRIELFARGEIPAHWQKFGNQ